MKTILLSLLILVASCTGCKKDNDIKGGYIPETAVGKWMYGSFAMSEFWSYDGQYQGNPFELAVVFDFKNDGTYEKYFMASARDYSCTTQAFTYEKGSVNFDEAAGTFTTTPVKGNYRGFYSCVPSKNINRDMKESELKPQKYYYEVTTGSNGQRNIVVRFKETDTNTSTFRPTNW